MNIDHLPLFQEGDDVIDEVIVPDVDEVRLRTLLDFAVDRILLRSLDTEARNFVVFELLDVNLARDDAY